ncbi:MAG: Branched-chain alpha-keto acid dehydrogenase, E1 component, beta subunit [Ignavibacteriae bacterium]|nr:MAG: Branched-chain alpha-keto acid dehydrogenase, E1 component, beta subunit [Ignavibacteriota bacterium]
MPVLSYIEAISKGMWEEMERDESVFLLGEDIGTYGGAFKATKGFLEKFGEKRVIDTVIAESAIVGAAIGAALAGLKPIAEMQFADFVTNAFTQLVNNAAKTYFRWNIPLPIVVRLPSGGKIHGGPFHSLNPEAWFFHVPGLKIVAPATPYDAKGLIKAAIRDPNPVLYIEHKYLYRNIKGEVPDLDYVLPIGSADVKRSGVDLTVITYGSMLHWSLKAADRLYAEIGAETEIVDLRSLIPLDKDTIFKSVKKTGKALIVHEDTVTGGIGAEISALITENIFEYLDAPIMRVAALDTPVPYSPPLENYFLPDENKIFNALKKLNEY